MRMFVFAMGIIFTGLLGALVGSLGYLGAVANNSADTNKEAAIALVRNVSQSWSIEGRHDIFTDKAVSQNRSPTAQRALATMSRLGSLVEVSDVSQTGYSMDLGDGITATIVFKGLFENGTSNVTVRLRDIGGNLKIVELDLKNIALWTKYQRRASV